MILVIDMGTKSDTEGLTCFLGTARIIKFGLSSKLKSFDQSYPYPFIGYRPRLCRRTFVWDPTSCLTRSSHDEKKYIYQTIDSFYGGRRGRGVRTVKTQRFTDGSHKKRQINLGTVVFIALHVNKWMCTHGDIPASRFQRLDVLHGTRCTGPLRSGAGYSHLTAILDASNEDHLHALTPNSSHG
ncbi:hypothetical protein EVAR_50798_1 [Eumeta japonica]|uniref:Uncharacterized protein n=1 Tax=Eumeta variegata TaxID=151549 RepID=A0A4C1XEA7_EUMVA|nr:hypothetical protein EVAR_50798_1 [Eumeta japonica]